MWLEYMATPTASCEVLIHSNIDFTATAMAPRFAAKPFTVLFAPNAVLNSGVVSRPK